MKKIAFLGLGGVGGYFGAKLARHYAASNEIEVLFLASERTAEVVREKGIRLITPEEEFTACPHRVATESDQGIIADFLICSVKSYDLENSLLQFSTFINPQTVILPLQNGIDATERVKRMFPNNEVWQGCVYIVSRITAPGVITETGNIHRLHFGSSTGDVRKLQSFYSLVRSAHEDTFYEQEIHSVLWEKFVFISPLATLTSFLDVCIGKILEHAESRNRLIQLLEEITTVAQAENILLPTEIISTTLAKMERLPYETTSSMHSDFQSQHRTELEALTGYVIKLAERHDIPVPEYTKIYAVLSLNRN